MTATGGVQVKQRRRRGLRLVISAVAILAAIIAVERMLPWTCCTPHIVSDETWIDLERARRLWRASVGMAMPGAPDPATFAERLSQAKLALGAPVFVRIFKREFELEIWMKRDGKFQRFATYPICMWSGELGPKLAEGDRQTPEGFYTVDKTALNPNSRYSRSFNIGYPNVQDKALNRTGSLIMVHGACVSVGCFAMTDAQIDEIWRLVTAALDGGQQRFQIQVFPFRMTVANAERTKHHSAAQFWRTLQQGYDIFESSLLPPRVSVCGERYAFQSAGPNANGDAQIDARCPSGASRPS
jgi:murein L,D-transpeptidase YafK